MAETTKSSYYDMQMEGGSGVGAAPSPLHPTPTPPTPPPSKYDYNYYGRAFTRMALPYFRDQPSSRWMLALLALLTLVNSGVRVMFSYLARDFWSALSDNDPDVFYGIMKQFVLAMVILAPVSVALRFLRQRLAIHWREWMTERSMALYFSTPQVYYGLEQQQPESFDTNLEDTTTTLPLVDNPDQRMAEDIRSFTEFSLTLFLTVLMAVVDLICFSIVLFSIMPSLFLAILLFATFGTLGTIVLGCTLIPLNFDKLQREANFRFALVRVRENAESIAFWRGTPVEHDKVTTQFQSVLQNMHALNAALRNLEFFTTYYTYLTWIVPILVVAPQYFAGAVELGVVQQAAASFAHVLDDLSILVTNWDSLTEFSAGMDRLYTFFTVAQNLAHPDGSSKEQAPIFLMDVDKQSSVSSLTTNKTPLSEDNQWAKMEEATSQQTASKIQLTQVPTNTSQNRSQPQPVLEFRHLTLTTPHGQRTLIQSMSLSVNWGQNLLICGSSGQGKSSLLRAIAGLWTSGSGSILRPRDEEVVFLPQKPYCVVGTLRDQLLYPCTTHYLDPRRLQNPSGKMNSMSDTVQDQLPRYDPTRTITDEQLLGILQRLDLAELPLRAGQGNAIRGLDTVMDWSKMLSLGEQQRLAFGRILVNNPQYVILDESTSALDMASERRMYGLLQTSEPRHGEQQRHTSYVSVGHRPSLLEYHDTKLTLEGDTFSVDPIAH